jgi:hypothetical protein
MIPQLLPLIVKSLSLRRFRRRMEELHNSSNDALQTPALSSTVVSPHRDDRCAFRPAILYNTSSTPASRKGFERGHPVCSNAAQGRARTRTWINGKWQKMGVDLGQVKKVSSLAVPMDGRSWFHVLRKAATSLGPLGPLLAMCNVNVLPAIRQNAGPCRDDAGRLRPVF